MANKDIRNELHGLIKLISFFKQIRHKDTLETLGFYFVNDLFNIIQYRQCILWSYRAGKVKILSASGQIDIEENGPLAQFVRNTVKDKLSNEDMISDQGKREAFVEENSFAYISNFTAEELKSFSNHDIEEFLAPHVSNILLMNNTGVIGGLWLARDKPLSVMDHAVVEDACDALAVRMASFSRYKKAVSGSRWGKYIKLCALIALLVFCLWPVRFSITATAEIVAKDSSVVTIPFNGLVEEVHVNPNEPVKDGAVLFSLDKTRLRNEVAISTQALKTAQERLLKTEREVFLDPQKTSDLNLLKEEVQLKALELSYAKDRFELSDVKAGRAGIALFSDKNDIAGRPVNAGEKIMTIADPAQMELMIRIPADSMIEINQEIPVRFFLNVAPLVSHKASLFNISYKPSADAGGLLTYKARAKIKDIENIEKIGLTGTAKLYGGRTVMILNLLRRPLIALRNLSSF